ncbi:MAG: sulfite oxidase heme-binding subunit YedZ [Clostridium perfringens]|nr:sulfite oxidase heme-binding subunit YedZ [Clostridium perfringens]
MLDKLTLGIKKYSRKIYSVAAIIAICSIIFNILYVYSGLEMPRILFLGNQLFAKGFLSTGIFIIVMFTGAFSTRWFITKLLLRIRGELAIIASIFIIPHMFESLLFSLVGIYSSKSLLLIIIIGILAFIIVMFLCLISFKRIRNKMNGKRWKKLQRWSYVFYFLIYFHIMLAFLFFGSKPKILDCLALTFIFLVYTLLRLLKYSSDKDKRERATRKARRSVNKSRQERGL